MRSNLHLRPRPLRSPRPLALLAVGVLAVGLAACDDATATDTGSVAVLGPDAAVAWSAPLESDWSPVDVTAAGDVTVVSQSWEIDEGSSVIGFSDTGAPLWVYANTYGAPLVTTIDGDVLVCSDTEVIDPVLLDPRTGEETGPGDVDDCDTPGDDETGTEFGGAGGPAIDRYRVEGTSLVVLDSDGEEQHTVTLEDSDPEIWTVDGAVITFDDASDTVRLYR